MLDPGTQITITYSGARPDPNQIMFNLRSNGTISIANLCGSAINDPSSTEIQGTYNASKWGADYIINWNYSTNAQPQTVAPNIATFPLENIDTMREEILAFAQTSLPFEINSTNLEPYRWIWEQPNGIPNLLMNQEGLAIKTYLNDRYNNWLETANIEYINNASAVSISGGKFTMDQLNFSQKMYDYLNRVPVS